ncbi:uncharacterized protein si:ch211-281p14.2 isoform X2 [Danio rerio]|uniref:Uncharacterized protein si:ch211-281p14.2 isoform X2 n=1 Tax=Danio rerio TaxID=7955 RepID=A0AC58G2J6_DANRE
MGASKATRKRCEQKKTGGGPAPPPHTPAEELALGFNANRPIVQGIPGGSSSLEPQPGTSKGTTVITVSNDTPTLVSIPFEVVAEVNSEETLSDECFEELTESMPSKRPFDRHSDKEGDIRSLYKRSLQHKVEYLELKKQKLQGEIELQQLMKTKMELEIQLLQKELQSKR